MRYALNIRMDLSVEEMYELRYSLKKKLANEQACKKDCEQKIEDWVGKGSIEVDNVLLCELNAATTRIHLLEDLLEQLEDAFTAAQIQDNRIWRRTRERKEAADR